MRLTFFPYELRMRHVFTVASYSRSTTPDIQVELTYDGLTGYGEAIEEAAFRLTKKAAETIDMTKHEGQHPRMGAVDVIPFVPAKDVTVDECVAISKRVAQRCWEELLRCQAFFCRHSSQTPLPVPSFSVSLPEQRWWSPWL